MSVVVRTVTMAASYAARGTVEQPGRSLYGWRVATRPDRDQCPCVGGRQEDGQAGRHAPATVHCRGSMAHDDDEQDRLLTDRQTEKTHDGDVEDGGPEKDGAQSISD